MSLGTQISIYRKKQNLTQTQLAEDVDVSFQSVSAWERDEYQPDIAHLKALARVLNTSVGVLVEEFEKPCWATDERYFSEKHMYTFVRSAALTMGLSQTLHVLPHVKRWHNGQLRDGAQAVPYIIHPLTMVCHALAMGITDDDVLSTILLHDVVEDCGVKIDELPANETVREAVQLLSYPADVDKAKIKPDYYARIQENSIACLVKCLDRCNNLSTMAIGFSREKMATYVQETEKYVFPLLKQLKDVWVQYNNASWLLSYQIKSLLATFQQLL